MAYEPKTWECGDIITAEDLNKMEQGIADASNDVSPMIVHATVSGDSSAYTVESIDKTFNEILEAGENGIPCIAMVQTPPPYPGAKSEVYQLQAYLYYRVAGVVEFYGNSFKDGTLSVSRLQVWGNGSEFLITQKTLS